MAEGKEGGSKGFAKVFQKRVTRTKELMLQNLGKADKTTDEEFDTYCNNFNKQQASAAKLQKELKNYVACAKAMSTSSKVFYETLKETYEDTWTGYTELVGAVESLAAIWDDYMNKLSGHIQEPLAAYIGRFPEMKNKISKRNRKLVYYDSARHNLTSLESAKKRDDNKVYKAEEDLKEAKRVYEEINTELHRELPALYDSRRSFLSSHFNSLFTAEAKSEVESGKIKDKLSDVTERLQRESSDVFLRPYGNKQTSRTSDVEETISTQSDTPPTLSKHYNIGIPNDRMADKHSDSDHRSQTSSGSSADVRASPKGSLHGVSTTAITTNDTAATESSSSSALGYASLSTTAYPSTAADRSHVAVTNGDIKVTTGEGSDVEREADSPVSPTSDLTYEAVNIGAQLNNNKDKPPDSPALGKAAIETENSTVDIVISGSTAGASVESDSDEDPEAAGNLYNLASNTGDIYSVPNSNQPVDSGLPKGVLYQVESIHPYNGEDTDELTFETGELINVVPFDDPDDQDDGWLMGYKLGSKEKGVFPENFTKRI